MGALPNWRVFLALAFIILLTGSWLRLRRLQEESVDGDELFSRRVALADTSKAIAAIEQDLVHPPLYYFLLKGTLPITGSGASGIRVLSLIAGIASIVIVLLWGVMAPEFRGAALLAATLLALSGPDIYYGQEARSYALYGLLTTLLILWALALERYEDKTMYWVSGTMYNDSSGIYALRWCVICLSGCNIHLVKQRRRLSQTTSVRLGEHSRFSAAPLARNRT